ncbi:MAG: alanine dehydrogenase, partial [Alphaproteobacteria bacterium]
MRIGVPREIKAEEKRVALTPAGASALVAHGHEVLVERDAGAGSGLADARYVDAGARIVDGPEQAWDAEMV